MKNNFKIKMIFAIATLALVSTTQSLAQSDEIDLEAYSSTVEEVDGVLVTSPPDRVKFDSCVECLNKGGNADPTNECRAITCYTANYKLAPNKKTYRYQTDQTRAKSGVCGRTRRNAPCKCDEQYGDLKGDDGRNIDEDSFKKKWKSLTGFDFVAPVVP